MKHRLLLLFILLLPAQALQAQAPSIRVEVVARQINVRATPGGAVLGTLDQGALIDVTGISTDRAWLYFLYWNQPAWITSAPQFVRAYGDLKQLAGSGEIEVMQYSIIPDIPEPGQPFMIALTLKADREMGSFKVASACAGFAMMAIQRLSPGVPQSLTLHCPGDPATGPHTAQLVIDVDQQVSQGSKQAITYFIDRRYSQVAMNWPAYSSLNLDGGKYDLTFDGQQVEALNGARLYRLQLTSLAMVHYDNLNTIELVDRLPATGLVGVVSAEGQRGALEITSIQGEAAQIEFRIYGDSNAS